MFITTCVFYPILQYSVHLIFLQKPFYWCILASTANTIILLSKSLFSVYKKCIANCKQLGVLVKYIYLMRVSCYLDG